MSAPADHAALPSLPTRLLGLTDMRITRVGFGAWAVGGAGWSFGWGPQDDADSIAAIRPRLSGTFFAGHDAWH